MPITVIKSLVTILTKATFILIVICCATLYSQTVMRAGETLELPAQLFPGWGFQERSYLTFEPNGHLAVKVWDGQQGFNLNTVWSTFLCGHKRKEFSTKLKLDFDNNLILSVDNCIIWQSSTTKFGEDGGYLRLENNKEMVLYNRKGEHLWSAGPKDNPLLTSLDSSVANSFIECEIAYGCLGKIFLRSNL
jgi:hypothetical protein